MLPSIINADSDMIVWINVYILININTKCLLIQYLILYRVTPAAPLADF